jgi:hypothetical protein
MAAFINTNIHQFNGFYLFPKSLAISHLKAFAAFRANDTQRGDPVTGVRLATKAEGLIFNLVAVTSLYLNCV